MASSYSNGNSLLPAPHPSLEELAAYHTDRVGPERVEEIRGHLVACEDCAAVVLELAAAAEPSAELEAGISELEVAAAWRRQRARLLEHGSLPGVKGEAARSVPRWAWAMAASLAFSVLALSVWVADLQQTVRQLREPQVNPPVLNLEPTGSVRDPSRPVPVAELATDSQRGWLILNLAGDPVYSSYRVELVTVDGRSVWVRDGLSRSESGNFRLELAGSLLPAAEYRVVLSGLRQGRHETVAEYSLRVVQP